MLHVVCAMAYGDCLITLSQLEAIDPGADWQLIGTGVTRRVSQLLRRPLPVVELLPDKAAFYTIKERGPLAAIRDYRHVRRELRSRCRPGDHLAFERRDLRNSGLLPPGTAGLYPPLSPSVYDDRRALVQSLFGHSREWAPARPPEQPVRRVLVNPCARYRRRHLSALLMENLLRLAGDRNWELTLVDPCGAYGDWASRVHAYLPRPELGDAAARLREADLYLGPDSFFVHLAYYYGVPHLGFYYPDHLYFLTPGMREHGGWLAFDAVEDYARLDAGVQRFLSTGPRT